MFGIMNVILYLLFLLIGIYIFYLLIKTAVKHGIEESLEDIEDAITNAIKNSKNEEELLNPEVYDYVFKNLNDNELMNFFGFNNADLMLEKENHKKGFTTWSMSFKIWQLIEKDSMKVIGNCGFHYWYIHQVNAEIGYEMTDVKCIGKGLMTEAAMKIIEYGFNTMNLNRIETFINPENTPSLKLIQRLNFTNEGHLRERYSRNNTIGDHVVFSILRREFNK